MYKKFICISIVLVSICLKFNFQLNASTYPILSAETGFFNHELKQHLEVKHKKDQLFPADFIKRHQLMPFGSTYRLNAAILVDQEKIKLSDFKKNNIQVNTRLNDLWTVILKVENFSDLLNIPGILYVETGGYVSAFLDKALPLTYADSVLFRPSDSLLSAYDGEGVIIAVIDWGFDYTHPMFYDKNGEKLRISRAWDQVKLSGPPPAGYDFGTEYIGTEQLLKAKTDTNTVYSNYHGTHVAACASSSGAGTEYIGPAPGAELIFITFHRTSASFIDAINYIKDYAESVNKPFVVNMSFGRHLGPHDGTDLKNKAISELAGPGRIFVGSAGNNGNDNFHLSQNFNDIKDTLKSRVGFGPNNYQTVSIWGSENSSFKTVLAVLSSTGNEVFRTRVFYTADNELIDDIIVVGNDTIQLKLISVGKSPINDKPNIQLEIKKKFGGTNIALYIISNDSEVHLWNCTQLDERYTNWGRPFLSGIIGYTAGDNKFGTGEPGGCGPDVITVGAFTSKNSFTNVKGQNFNYSGQLLDIAPFSAIGPTVDGRNKPDITAPGHTLFAAMNSHLDQTDTNSLVDYIEKDDLIYPVSTLSGTSMSGPMVAGIVALMLQANPELDHISAREIIRRTAYTDEFTGEIPETGNTQWGWGKINAFNAVYETEKWEAEEVPETEKLPFNVFPNPANDVIWIQIGEINPKNINLSLSDLTGRVLFQQKILNSDYIDKIKFEIPDLSEGIYILNIFDKNEFKSFKILIDKYFY